MARGRRKTSIINKENASAKSNLQGEKRKLSMTPEPHSTRTRSASRNKTPTTTARSRSVNTSNSTKTTKTRSRSLGERKKEKISKSVTRERTRSPKRRKSSAPSAHDVLLHDTEEQPIEILETRFVDGKLVDSCCWICHRKGESDDLFCNLCPRAYHLACVKKNRSGPISSDFCHCSKQTIDGINTPVLLDLCNLKFNLKFLKAQVTREAKKVSSMSKDLQYLFSWPALKNNNLLVEIRDYNGILDRIDSTPPYPNTNKFYMDLRWIHHNSHIALGPRHPSTRAALWFEKKIKDCLQEFELCFDCYREAHLSNKPESESFIEICRKSHQLVWAKMRGSPYWPAKVMQKHSTYAVVKFFGTHDQANISYDSIYMMSMNHPEKRNDPTFQQVLKTVEARHLKLSNRFVYACYELCNYCRHFYNKTTKAYPFVKDLRRLDGSEISKKRSSISGKGVQGNTAEGVNESRLGTSSEQVVSENDIEDATVSTSGLTDEDHSFLSKNPTPFIEVDFPDFVESSSSPVIVEAATAPVIVETASTPIIVGTTSNSVIISDEAGTHSMAGDTTGIHNTYLNDDGGNPSPSQGVNLKKLPDYMDFVQMSYNEDYEDVGNESDASALNSETRNNIPQTSEAISSGSNVNNNLQNSIPMPIITSTQSKQGINEDNDDSNENSDDTDDEVRFVGESSGNKLSITIPTDELPDFSIDEAFIKKAIAEILVSSKPNVRKQLKASTLQFQRIQQNLLFEMCGARSYEWASSKNFLILLRQREDYKKKFTELKEKYDHALRMAHEKEIALSKKTRAGGEQEKSNIDYEEKFIQMQKESLYLRSLLAKSCEKKKEEKEALQKRVEELEKKNDNLNTENVKLKEITENLQSENNLLKQQNKILIKEHKMTQNKLEYHERKMVALQKQCKKLQSEIKMRKKEKLKMDYKNKHKSPGCSLRMYQRQVVVRHEQNLCHSDDSEMGELSFSSMLPQMSPSEQNIPMEGTFSSVEPYGGSLPSFQTLKQPDINIAGSSTTAVPVINPATSSTDASIVIPVTSATDALATSATDALATSATEDPVIIQATSTTDIPGVSVAVHPRAPVTLNIPMKFSSQLPYKTRRN